MALDCSHFKFDSSSTMFCKWSLLFTILTVLLAKLVSGVCCRSTVIAFRIDNKYNVYCSYFEEGKRVNFNRRHCTTTLCGGLLHPTPCCGRGSCNIFCCNCDNGCHDRNSRVLIDFRSKYWKLIYDVYERNID